MTHVTYGLLCVSLGVRILSMAVEGIGVPGTNVFLLLRPISASTLDVEISDFRHKGVGHTLKWEIWKWKMKDGRWKIENEQDWLTRSVCAEAAKSSLADLVVFDDNAQGLAPREQGCAPMSQIITGNCWMTNCQACATNVRGHVPSMQRYGWVVYRIWNHDIALKQSNVTDEFVLWPCYFKCLLDMTYETQFWYSIQVIGCCFLFGHSWHQQSCPSKKESLPGFCLGKQNSVANH